MLKLTTDKHEASRRSRGLSATAEFLVNISVSCNESFEQFSLIIEFL